MDDEGIKINRETYADDWEMSAIEHPNVDMNHFTTKPPRSTPKFKAEAAQKNLDSLYHPFKIFSPVRSATECGRNFTFQIVAYNIFIPLWRKNLTKIAYLFKKKLESSKNSL